MAVGSQASVDSHGKDEEEIILLFPRILFNLP